MLSIAALSASALIVGNSVPMMQQVRMSSPMMAGAGDTLASIEGPDIYWGEKGPLENPPLEESDFKEFDSYSTFLGACQSHGIDLNQPDITVLAPGNNACDEFTSTGGELSKAVCEYHIIKGVVNADSLSNGELTTLEGSAITYRRMFRKHFLDNAFTDVSNSPPRSSYKANIPADNGLIHMLNEVIYPGWSESSGGYGSAGDPAATRA